MAASAALLAPGWQSVGEGNLMGGACNIQLSALPLYSQQLNAGVHCQVLGPGGRHERPSVGKCSPEGGDLRAVSPLQLGSAAPELPLLPCPAAFSSQAALGT